MAKRSLLRERPWYLCMERKAEIQVEQRLVARTNQGDCRGTLECGRFTGREAMARQKGSAGYNISRMGQSSLKDMVAVEGFEPPARGL